MDIDAGAAFVRAIEPHAAATRRPGATGGLGGFAALFDPAAAGFVDPVLVAAADGVGTKLMVANAAGMRDSIGVDLVAMCVNDVVVQGAEPLFFLDYFATGRLDAALAAEVVAGIAQGCRAAGCALIGGETAELPGLYRDRDYDLAGFAVGAAERGQLLTGETIAEGDVVLGLASNGLHANGFSLVRRVVERCGLGYRDPAPFADAALGAALLAPSRIYVRAALAAHRAGRIGGLAHVTGGGIVDNLARTLPAGLAAELDARAWPLPDVFAWLMEAAGAAPAEMSRTFNCGLGMIAVARPADAVEAERIFAAAGETTFRIGVIAARTPGLPPVTIDGTESAWPR